MSNLHGLFHNLVQLEPVSHTYSDILGNEYLSVSRFLRTLYTQFEDSVPYKIASEETRATWKEKGRIASEHGTRIHEALELYNKTGQVLEVNKELVDAIRSITEVYKGYNKTYDEICLYDKDFFIAGTADKICAVSNRKDSEVDVADFKTNLKGHITFYSEYKKRMFAPLDHLQDCEYTKYSLQLSIYAYFFEKLTGRRVRQMFIHYIPPSNLLSHYKIPVIYLKQEVEMILKVYKEKKSNLVLPIEQLNENGEF